MARKGLGGRKFSIILVLAVVTAAGGASAQSIQVTYGLTPSQTGVPAAPGTSHLDLSHPAAIPNFAPITGSVVVAFTGDGSGNISDGPVALQSLEISVNLNVPGFGAQVAGLAGTVAVSSDAPISSELTGAGIQPVAADLHLSGTASCSFDEACSILGIPQTTTFNQDVSSSFDATIDPGDPSSLSLDFPVDIKLGSFQTSGTLVLAGNEVVGSVAPGAVGGPPSIPPIPEPSGLVLLVSGFATVALLTRA